MQNSTKPTARLIGVLLFDGFSNHCLANSVEPFRAANMFCEREAYRWRFLTVDGLPVVSSSGLPVVPHARLSDHSAGDALFLLPSYGFRRETRPEVMTAIRAASRRFSLVVGMDTGAWLMAAAGLLDGCRATIHWDELTDFSEQFPEIDVVSERFVLDDDRATCGGASTAFDLVLRLIQLQNGSRIRLEVQTLFMPDHGPNLDDPMIRPHRSAFLNAAIALMRQNIEDVLSIPEIARQTHQNQKSMERLFGKELGLSPSEVYRHLRLVEVRRLLGKTRLSVAEISVRCGYADPSAMTRAFRAEFGKSPSAWRKESN